MSEILAMQAFEMAEQAEDARVVSSLSFGCTSNTYVPDVDGDK
jgi:hypothetical protein